MLPPKWSPELNWETAPGKALKELAQRLNASGIGALTVTVFGSAPLQMAIDPQFASAYVDIFSEHDLSDLILDYRLGRGHSDFYIEYCAPSTFRSAPDWGLRSFTILVGKITFCFPHPVDILVSKLPRLEVKDLAAFRLVSRKLGLPTEEQLRELLQNAVDLYRPSFDEEQKSGDIYLNTQTVWRELYGKEINVRDEIIRPALERRKKDYGTKRNYKALLARIQTSEFKAFQPRSQASKRR
jgi:hypothetical protein